MKSSYDGFHQVSTLHKTLTEAQKGWNGPESKKIKEASAALEKKIDAVETGSKTAPGFGPVNRDRRGDVSVESADMRPAETVRACTAEL